MSLRHEESGVTIFNKIEHFGNEKKLRFARHCLTKFEYPLYIESDWILNYTFVNETSRKFHAYLLREDGSFFCKEERFCATFSVVTSDGSFHLLGEFSNVPFRVKTAKEIELKELSSVSEISTYLFPDDTLTLRCHLWSSSIGYCIVTYHAITRCGMERIEFPFTFVGVQGEDCLKFESCLREYPLHQIIENKHHRLQLELTFQDFSGSKVPCCMRIRKQYDDFNLYYSYQLFAKCSGDGSDLELMEERNYFHMIEGFRNRREEFSLDLSQLKENKELYYPNGVLTILCVLKLVRNSNTDINKISFGTEATISSSYCAVGADSELQSSSSQPYLDSIKLRRNSSSIEESEEIITTTEGLNLDLSKNTETDKIEVPSEVKEDPHNPVYSHDSEKTESALEENEDCQNPQHSGDNPVENGLPGMTEDLHNPVHSHDSEKTESALEETDDCKISQQSGDNPVENSLPGMTEEVPKENGRHNAELSSDNPIEKSLPETKEVAPKENELQNPISVKLDTISKLVETC